MVAHRKHRKRGEKKRTMLRLGKTAIYLCVLVAFAATCSQEAAGRPQPAQLGAGNWLRSPARADEPSAIGFRAAHQFDSTPSKSNENKQLPGEVVELAKLLDELWRRKAAEDEEEEAHGRGRRSSSLRTPSGGSPEKRFKFKDSSSASALRPAESYNSAQLGADLTASSSYAEDPVGYQYKPRVMSTARGFGKRSSARRLGWCARCAN